MKKEQLITEIERRWKMNLGRLDWYVCLQADIKQYFFHHPKTEIEKHVRWVLYDLVTEALEQGDVGLGEEGINWDVERKPIKFVVIHHSGTDPEVSISRLSAMGLLRVYAPIYLNKEQFPEAYGNPIHSHHWKDGRQVFYTYHWLIRQNGAAERLLEDNQIGWHAGDWRINCASIGICLAGNYSLENPTEAALEKLSSILKTYKKIDILPHCEINQKTDCPGAWINEQRWNNLHKK